MEKLYKPVIVKKEVDDEHYYYVDGEYYPGVTTILSQAMPTPYALRRWIGEVGNEKADAKLEKAGERGSKIHHACEELLAGGSVNLHEEFPSKEDQKCIVSFANWVAEVQPEVLGIEKTVASKLKYAGTLDIHCKIDGEEWIIDIKTSGNVYDSHKLQIIAYQNAVLEMTGKLCKVGILHLNPRTIKGWTFHKTMKIAGKTVEIEDFMRVYEMYKMLNGGRIPEPKEVNVYPERISLEGAQLN